ncbi:copper chaperone PCu(A)C [Streptacidiphilus sp. PB12-B1b]|uniref:copper chaperone PCu(A)C n=1 Tax=Streptacidiphilus sp. PB12-B1b TaxID=2705012 RepID=UPI0015F798A0|nr:copper chaperone PCu(A)C [Streptacidiphilus sp. PB12-B1b]QMU76272.1 copper chaperone PCu(A)C [Streptacidiphilus sp. PB12-B1b]
MEDDRQSHEPTGADEEADAELEALEQEAADLAARAEQRGGLRGSRRLLVLQAPILIAVAVVLLLWSRGTSVSAAAASAPPAAAPAKIGMVNAYLTAPSDGTVRAYVVIKNNGGTADRLVGASSPWATSISLAEGSSPASLPWITIPAHSTVTLKPGGYSVLLSGLTRTPKAGDTIQLNLNFAASGTVYVFAPEGPASSLTVQDVMDAMKHMDKLPPQ